MANWVAAGVVALGGVGLLGGWRRGGRSAIKMTLLSATVRFSKFHPKFWPVWAGALSQIGRYVTQSLVTLGSGCTLCYWKLTTFYVWFYECSLLNKHVFRSSTVLIL